MYVKFREDPAAINITKDADKIIFFFIEIFALRIKNKVIGKYAIINIFENMATM